MNKSLKVIFSLIILTNTVLLISYYYKTPLTDFKETLIEDKKVVLYECVYGWCGGLSDRLRGIVSAWAMAKLTDRRVEINMSIPCPLENYLEPNENDWTPTESEYKTIYELKKLDDAELSRNISNIDKRYEIIKLKNYNRILIPRSNENKNLQKRLSEIGFHHNNFTYDVLFKIVYKQLFKLAPRLQVKYETFLRLAKPTDKTQLICAQVRIGGARPGVAADVEFTPRNNSMLFWNFINETFIQMKNLTDYKIFVTSDTEDVVKEAHDYFGDSRMVTIPGEHVHLDRTFIKKTECHRADKVFLDFHAMQNCDMAVISKGGYGLSSILNRPKPFKDLYRYFDSKFKKVYKY